MTRRSDTCLTPQALLAILFLAVPVLGFSQYTDRTRLAAAEAKTVEHCLEIIRGCQLADGAFTMIGHGKAPQSPVWVAPYFVQHAVLGLLAANHWRENPGDIERVGKWLEWCANHQEPGGFWFDYEGTVAGYRSNGMVDAHDSSAAMFLLVVERYQRSGARVSPEVMATARKALKCITNLADTDGLTWAKAGYRIKYLMDNVEVYGGLTAAQVMFTKSGEIAQAALAAKQLLAMSKPLLAYWEAIERQRFAWALNASGAYEGGLERIYPHGLAQLFGVDFVAAYPTPFVEACSKFPPETTRGGVGAERFLLAASRLGGAELVKWREEVVRDANAFTPDSVYIFRPGLVILALLEGADWMPHLQP